MPGRGTARLPAHPTAWGRSPSRPRGRAVAKLNRTLTKRRDDILALSDHRDSSNDPTGIINGRFEHLRDHPSFPEPDPTTSPNHYSRPAGLHPTYTRDCEEQHIWVSAVRLHGIGGRMINKFISFSDLLFRLGLTN